MSDNINLKCYKIVCDLNHNMKNIITHLSKIGDILFYNKSLYIYLDYEYCGQDIITKQLTKQCKIKMFYVENITANNINNFEIPIISWFNEHYAKDQEKDIEKENQKKLQNMMDNIQKATELLEEKLRKAEQAQKSVEEKNIITGGGTEDE